MVKYMRHCLWRKKNQDVQARGNALISWDKVCKPKKQGGLGVLNLPIQNKALLLKNLDKFYNRHDVPWVNLIWESYYSNGMLPDKINVGSFWWKSHLKLLDLYKGMARCKTGNGSTAFFWTDLWQDACLHQKFPHLVTYAKDFSITVKDAASQEFLQDLFHLPLSHQAYEEFIQMEEICSNTEISIQHGNLDSWSYIWGSDTFSTKKAYLLMNGEQQTPPHFSWIWKSSCQARHKFFFWLLLHDRLNTRNLLGRKNFTLQSYLCVNYGTNQEETLFHLFWSCPFATACWNHICPQRVRYPSVLENISEIRDKLKVPFSMDIIIIGAWSIWIIRNNKIFNDQNPILNAWKAIFMQELDLLRYRMKKKYAESFRNWLQSQH
jgi:hypothetical protein